MAFPRRPCRPASRHRGRTIVGAAPESRRGVILVNRTNRPCGHPGVEREPGLLAGPALEGLPAVRQGLQREYLAALMRADGDAVGDRGTQIPPTRRSSECGIGASADAERCGTELLRKQTADQRVAATIRQHCRRYRAADPRDELQKDGCVSIIHTYVHTWKGDRDDQPQIASIQ